MARDFLVWHQKVEFKGSAKFSIMHRTSSYNKISVALRLTKLALSWNICVKNKVVLFSYGRNSGTKPYWLALENADNDSVFSSEVLRIYIECFLSRMIWSLYNFNFRDRKYQTLGIFSSLWKLIGRVQKFPYNLHPVFPTVNICLTKLCFTP